MPFLNYSSYLHQHKIKTFGIFCRSLTLIMGNQFYISEAFAMPFCGIGIIFGSCVAWNRNCAFFELEALPAPTQNQDIWNFSGSLTE